MKARRWGGNKPVSQQLADRSRDLDAMTGEAPAPRPQKDTPKTYAVILSAAAHAELLAASDSDAWARVDKGPVRSRRRSFVEAAITHYACTLPELAERAALLERVMQGDKQAERDLARDHGITFGPDPEPTERPLPATAEPTGRLAQHLENRDRQQTAEMRRLLKRA